MSNGRKKTSPFAGIPNRVIEQKDFENLSPTELKLIILFAYQYRGKNNGKLCAPFSQAKKVGIKSEASLSRGLNSLLQKEYISITKASTPYDRKNAGRSPVYYAITWEKIDEILDFKYDPGIFPTKKPQRTFIDELDKRI